jgi:hypothetical protein
VEWPKARREITRLCVIRSYLTESLVVGDPRFHEDDANVNNIEDIY